MATLSETRLLHLLLALAALLVLARTFGEIARRLGLPEVLGQLLAGVALGPSLLGRLLPGVYDVMFGDPPAANGLSAISWLGAIMIFLSAGAEADTRVLRERARPGLIVAAGAIVPSIAGGTLLGWLVLGQPPIAGLFLGVTLSVTAVSVVVTILDERGAMRRDYGQILLVGGVVTEMLVWVLIPVASALLDGSESPALAALLSVAGVTGVFLFMLTVGRLAVHGALRCVADHARLIRSPISVVIGVTLLSAALTQALNLHPLLGAFAAGMVLVRAPRVRPPLLQSVQTLTSGFLAPIFFAFAGAQVNLLRLGGWQGIRDVVALLVSASVIKIGFSVLAGRLSGLRPADSAIIGLGMNLKGGTDVVVALVGTELGFFSSRVDSTYGAVAVLTVLLTAPVLSRLERSTEPSAEEQRRLEREAVQGGNYLARLERVLAPTGADPGVLDGVLAAFGEDRRGQGRPFDTVRVDGPARTHRACETSGVGGQFDLVAEIVDAPSPGTALALDDALDDILRERRVDVLLAVGAGSLRDVRRIVVRFDERTPSFHAVDLAVCLAERFGSEIVALRVQPPRSDVEPEGRASAIEQVLAPRLGRDGPELRSKIVIGADVADAVLDEVSSGDLVVMGARSHRGAPDSRLGLTVHRVLLATAAPAVVLFPR